MTSKTRLIYWLFVATMSFNDSTTQASDSSKKSKCTGANHDNFVDCATLFGNAGHEEYNNCLKRFNLKSIEADCISEVKNNLKSSIFPGDKKQNDKDQKKY